MKVTKYIAAISVITVMTSCEKELDFEYHDIAPLTVVEASLSWSGCEVSLTNTTPMQQPLDTVRITDASVILTDLTNGDVKVLNADEYGMFRDVTPGVTGHKYRLSININGNEYSAESTMLSAVEIKDAVFNWIKMPGDDMAALKILFTDNQQTADYYWVRVYRNGKAYSWSVINDLAGVDGIIEETITTTHRDPANEDEKSLLVDGDRVTVSVTHIDRAMFDHLVAISNGNNGFNIIQGDRCLGFFIASPIAQKIITYNPDRIEYAR